MNKEELIKELNRIKKQYIDVGYDPEMAHGSADDALLKYINDADIAEAYDAIEPKWYA